MVHVDVVRNQVAAAYYYISRLRSTDPEKQAKIRDLQLAMEKVQIMFSEIFP